MFLKIFVQIWPLIISGYKQKVRDRRCTPKLNMLLDLCYIIFLPLNYKGELVTWQSYEWKDHNLKMGKKENFSLQAFLALICLQLMLLTCNASVFKQGRYKDGFLRPPNIKYDAELPPDMWFTQKLDHFNPQDLRTWQQVGYNQHNHSLFFWANVCVFTTMKSEFTIYIYYLLHRDTPVTCQAP